MKQYLGTYVVLLFIGVLGLAFINWFLIRTLMVIGG